MAFSRFLLSSSSPLPPSSLPLSLSVSVRAESHRFQSSLCKSSFVKCVQSTVDTHTDTEWNEEISSNGQKRMKNEATKTTKSVEERSESWQRVTADRHTLHTIEWIMISINSWAVELVVPTAFSVLSTIYVFVDCFAFWYCAMACTRPNTQNVEVKSFFSLIFHFLIETSTYHARDECSTNQILR